jgi:hypothetical protein
MFRLPPSLQKKFPMLLMTAGKEPRTKNKKPKMFFVFGSSFFVFRSPTHRTMCPSTQDIVCAPRSISHELASVKDFLKNSSGKFASDGR